MVCFCAACVLHTRVELLQEIKENGSIFKFISASDITWAVLVYTNTFSCWRYLIEENKTEGTVDKKGLYGQWVQRAVVVPVE